MKNKVYRMKRARAKFNTVIVLSLARALGHTVSLDVSWVKKLGKPYFHPSRVKYEKLLNEKQSFNFVLLQFAEENQIK